MRVERKKRPTRVIRASEALAWSGPNRWSESATMDRNFQALNRVPPRPTRSCP